MQHLRRADPAALSHDERSPRGLLSQIYQAGGGFERHFSVSRLSLVIS